MILGLDTGVNTTGWCAGDGSTVPECGVLTFGGMDQPDGVLGKKVLAGLRVLKERFNPTLVIRERSILVVKHGDRGRTDNPAFLRKRYGMDFLIDTYWEMVGVRYEDRSLQAIKREVTGNPNAEKGALVEVARKCGLDLPDGPGAKDAADAWGAWLLGLRVQSPALSRRWDIATWSPRGSLL